MGIIYLPLVAFLSTAITLIPYREYRSLRELSTVATNSPSPELVAGTLMMLRPKLRIYALFLLGFAFIVAISFLFLPGPWSGRALPTAVMLSAIIFFGTQFRVERRIVANHACTMARIVRFEHRQRSRAAIYQYQGPGGTSLTSRGGSLHGFSVDMAVPIFYNASQPQQSRPVPDFIFYRILAQRL